MAISRVRGLSIFNFSQFCLWASLLVFLPSLVYLKCRLPHGFAKSSAFMHHSPFGGTLGCAETAHLLYIDLRIIYDYAQTTYSTRHNDESQNHRPTEVGRDHWR